MTKRKKIHQHASHSIPKFRPLTDEQEEAYRMCWRNYITFLTGPAGCSKSYTAVAYAVDKLLSGGVEQVVFTRPAIEACGEQLGFLPGTAIQKVSSYLHPLFDNLNDYAGDMALVVKADLKIEPLAYMRGRTVKNSVLILDEAQNANLSQLKMLLTRIGEGSSFVICGDAEQSDIANSKLMLVAEAMSKVDGISHLHFTSTSAAIRHPLIPHIIDAFDSLSGGGA
jgi:phosphate starvation-inducible PhoH-like protein